MTLGKIVGGGLPLAAFGGRRSNGVFESIGVGISSGYVVWKSSCCRCRSATLELLTDDLYTELDGKAARIEEGLSELVKVSSIICSSRFDVYVVFPTGCSE